MATTIAVTRSGPHADNHHTLASGRVESTKDLTPKQMEAQMAEVLPYLRFGETFRRKANIDGIVVQLVTNSRHQYEFWSENWHTAPESVKPHGHLYSVSGVPGRKAHAYYCPGTDTALFVNTDYYGQCKSWALGLAAVILERKFDTHSIHGAAAEVDGKGIVIIAPTGTGKTTQVNRLMQHPKGKVIGDDWVYIHHPPGIGDDDKLNVYQPEVALYVRTENAENEPWLIPIFDRCKVENVVRERGKCESPSCQKGNCMFNQGYDYCYWGFGNSRALLPREWMMGPERVKDETGIDLIVLLRRDEKEPSVVELDEDQLVEVLREGRTLIRPGAGPREKWGTYASEPWYNPYLLAPDHARQEEFFRNEARRAKCVLLNTAHQGIDETYRLILKYAGVRE
jgi:ATP-dependent phosphoenolpyruvate carboxykinase